MLTLSILQTLVFSWAVCSLMSSSSSPYEFHALALVTTPDHRHDEDCKAEEDTSTTSTNSGSCHARESGSNSNSPKLETILSNLHTHKLYINGTWTSSSSSSASASDESQTFTVLDPSTSFPITTIASASKEDVNRAVQAATDALPAWSKKTLSERLDHLTQLMELYEERWEDFSILISAEMGAPIDFARESQVGGGMYVMKTFMDILQNGIFEFERTIPRSEHDDDGDKTTMIFMEPIGVVGMITPWNWPLYQVLLKVIPALAVGCTCILKPSELSPLSALLLTDLIDEAQFPHGVFNLINGDGGVVGHELASHPGTDMTSFTGSTGAGRIVSKAGAETFKRVSLELGGKGAFIVFADVNKAVNDDDSGNHNNFMDDRSVTLAEAIGHCVEGCFGNSGQSCNAPTRLLVERSVYTQAIEMARQVALEFTVGSAHEEGDHIGPVVSQLQFDKIQEYIRIGIQEGARLIIGGLGKEENIRGSAGTSSAGYYVRPTIFADCTSSMTIMKEEIFGPVLCIIPFDSQAEAIAIANDTPYGPTNYVYSRDHSNEAWQQER